MSPLGRALLRSANDGGSPRPRRGRNAVWLTATQKQRSRPFGTCKTRSAARSRPFCICKMASSVRSLCLCTSRAVPQRGVGRRASAQPVWQRGRACPCLARSPKPHACAAHTNAQLALRAPLSFAQKQNARRRTPDPIDTLSNPRRRAKARFCMWTRPAQTRSPVSGLACSACSKASSTRWTVVTL